MYFIARSRLTSRKGLFFPFSLVRRRSGVSDGRLRRERTTKRPPCTRRIYHDALVFTLFPAA